MKKTPAPAPKAAPKAAPKKTAAPKPGVKIKSAIRAGRTAYASE